MQIFNRDVDSESLVIASDEGDMKLNQSFDNADNNPYNNLARSNTIAGMTEARPMRSTYPNQEAQSFIRL